VLQARVASVKFYSHCAKSLATVSGSDRWGGFGRSRLCARDAQGQFGKHLDPTARILNARSAFDQLSRVADERFVEVFPNPVPVGAGVGVLQRGGFRKEPSFSYQPAFDVLS